MGRLTRNCVRLGNAAAAGVVPTRREGGAALFSDLGEETELRGEGIDLNGALAGDGKADFVGHAAALNISEATAAQENYDGNSQPGKEEVLTGKLLKSLSSVKHWKSESAKYRELVKRLGVSDVDLESLDAHGAAIEGKSNYTDALYGVVAGDGDGRGGNLRVRVMIDKLIDAKQAIEKYKSYVVRAKVLLNDLGLEDDGDSDDYNHSDGRRGHDRHRGVDFVGPRLRNPKSSSRRRVVGRGRRGVSLDASHRVAESARKRTRGEPSSRSFRGQGDRANEGELGPPSRRDLSDGMRKDDEDNPTLPSPSTSPSLSSEPDFTEEAYPSPNSSQSSYPSSRKSQKMMDIVKMLEDRLKFVSYQLHKSREDNARFDEDLKRLRRQFDEVTNANNRLAKEKEWLEIKLGEAEQRDAEREEDFRFIEKVAIDEEAIWETERREFNEHVMM